MRVFTKHTKVIGVAKHELDALADMIREASSTGKAERPMSATEYLAIEVNNVYGVHQPRPMDVERPMPHK